MEFHVIDSMIPFCWSRLDVVVDGISFHDLMIKLRHCDTSWRNVIISSDDA